MIIKVKAHPSSKNQEVIRISEGEYKVFLKERAEDNKANIELIKLLKKYFREKHGFCNIRIIKGVKSRDKIVEVK